jgi:murein DD-endopeptidase MepM/ murein hydrolase activator NlpD
MKCSQKVFISGNLKQVSQILNCLAFFMLFTFNLFSQNKEDSASEKIENYINLASTPTELKKIEIFEFEFPEIFKFYPNINPINPKVKPGLSSGFSSKRLHPIDGDIKSHNGVDIVASNGTPVYASASGIVIKSKFFNGKAGHSVELQHKYGFKTRYFHLSLFIVKNKERVKKGQIIGYLGNSGGSTGYHLHYEILKNGKYINPRIFLHIED